MSAPPNPSRILELGYAFLGAKTLLSAVELGLFTALGDGPLAADDLRARIGIHPRGAIDFFDALVALGLLDRHDGRYANTPDTELFLDRRKPSYVGGLLEMLNARAFRDWGKLTDALRTGEPQNEAGNTGTGFATLYEDTERVGVFARAMTGVSTGSGIALAHRIPWSEHRTVIDLGCAEGAVPVQIARAHPHLTGGGLDLPPVGRYFEAYVAANGLSDRLRFYPGDLFADPIPTADVLILGHVLHGVDLDQKRKLLTLVYAALPTGGRLVVHELLIDDDRRQNVMGLLMSLNMLIETPGGFDFTGAQCSAWMREAGFRDIDVAPLVGPDSMVVGRK